MAIADSSKLVAFIGATNLSQAREFYAGKLGLPVMSEDGFALVIDVQGTMLRISRVRQVMPAEYTVLGFDVPAIDATVQDLTSSGILFEKVAGISQNEAGIWDAPGGTRVAWFKDPDGNMLSVSQHSV